jgi:hypothetical protein
MSVRLIIDGAVYMIAAREAVALVRRLRYRAGLGPLSPATSAAVLLEWALEQERPPGITLTPDEAAVLRAVRRL